MPKCGMVVKEWLAEDFPLKIDQSTNTTKFTSCASRWDALIQASSSLHKQKKFNAARSWFGVWVEPDTGSVFLPQ
jgi:hypothetical protein